MIRAQRTLSTPVEFSGRGLHSGENVRVRVLPAPEDTGVEFVRTDVPDSSPIPAHIRFYSNKDRRSRLERGGCAVDTIEHLLAVCTGLQVDNLRVEMSGSEMPGLDGSAQTLVDLFGQSGIVDQSAQAKQFRPGGADLRQGWSGDPRGPSRRSPRSDGAVHRGLQRSRGGGRFLPPGRHARFLHAGDRPGANLLSGLGSGDATGGGTGEGGHARKHRGPRGSGHRAAHAGRSRSATSSWTCSGTFTCWGPISRRT